MFENQQQQSLETTADIVQKDSFVFNQKATNCQDDLQDSVNPEYQLSNRQKWLNFYNSFKTLCYIPPKSRRLIRRILLIIAILSLIGLLYLIHQREIEQKALEQAKKKEEALKKEKEEALKKEKEEALKKEKEKEPKLKCQSKVKQNLFYVNVDMEALTQEQKRQFDEQNKICGTYHNQDISALGSYIGIYNRYESTPLGNNEFIENKEKYSPENQRLLLILLHMYLHGSSYLHPKQSLQKIQDRCLDPIYYGNELIFNKIDDYNETTKIYMPSINSTLYKVARGNNWMIKKLIKSIVNGEDVLSFCKYYQCAIMNCDKKEIN